MTNSKLYRSKKVLFGLILFVSFTCFFSFDLSAGESKNGKLETEFALKSDSISTGDLKIYERKSLFIFPVLHSTDIDPALFNGRRKQFLTWLMYQMFVTDFRRIDFFEVKSGQSIDTFLQDAHSYILENVKHITALRMQPDGKFKEVMVTGEELLKTTENSFAMVPFIDSIERRIVKGKKSTGYSYDIYVHFDVYSTKTKENIKTLRINNKKNVIGILASFTGSLMLDHSDLEGLPENEKEDEKSFRNAIAGLYTVLKKDMKEMPEFKIMGTLSRVSRSSFGFDMGHDTGIKIDHRYKTFVSKASGGKKMTGFGKIRKVKNTYSEAQILIGRPQEGDQMEEDPKVGINIVGGIGTAPLHISRGSDEVVGSHRCVFLGAEYELGPLFGLSEYYFNMNLRMGLPKPEEMYNTETVSQFFLNFGILKKIYFRRFALNLAGYVGFHSAGVTDMGDEIDGTSLGFTFNTALEVMITPSISAYGGFNLDVYSNPGTYTENDEEYDFPPHWEWNAKGVSFNFGAKITF